MTFRDTIAAIATPSGVGGVGLIRISGPSAEGIARRLFRPSRPLAAFLSHHLYHGEIVSLDTGSTLDEVLAAFMKGPHTYTGEDTLEISCHGGPLILRTVLNEIVKAGARPAERGEFTKRAFLNNRLDLSQAEAVLDLVTAQTREGVAAAAGRLKGKLSARIGIIRSAIIDLLAGIEASIDFSDEDGIVEAPGGALTGFQAPIDDLNALAATYRRGRITREGVGIVIAGRPNVGKSSLLNRLLGEKRAIVTPIPGTTRDFIEEAVDIRGIPVRLTDTAGIRPPENAIEKEGIDLVWERLAAADAILFLLDGSMALTPEDCELLTKIQEKAVIPVINKSDLPQHIDGEALVGLLPGTAPSPIRISAKYGSGIDSLTAAIRTIVLAAPAEEAPEVMIAHLRYKVALERAAERLMHARDGLREGLAPELAALEVREALDALGEITGRTTAEEVIERIFAKFCVGK
jgi:tRNA modification GTPase